MATTPDKDIQNLIAGLKSGPAKKAPRPRAKQEPDKRSLVAAIAIIVLGFGYVAYSSFSDAPQGGPPEDEPEPHPEERSLHQNYSPSMPGVAAGAGSGGAMVYGRALRPGNFLAELFTNGQLPEFFPVSKVEEPPAGKTQIIYCLLHSRLDEYTESIWKSSGMLRDENFILSPYLRKVTISDRESLRNLIDWHVESVAFKLPDPPKQTE